MTEKIKDDTDLNPKKNSVYDDNLGLDADHSSDEPTLLTRLNDDNDRISGNPDGENDVNENYNSLVNSRLDDK
ncbi:hypothetical protein CPT03_09150 [Pedobacter ginsengisoli]|uniref:Uncharacterized protein n=1 Tax=Pedobacter ginsengisoli TaxID=363852 RepID=A0A2D1U4V3_9SPHI|nr:hypothetical protein [Pedobacter ginsengisoli]ATP56629.1 hypothetical protein CPT03_09150 [Pedobacter ginsengisoli]